MDMGKSHTYHTKQFYKRKRAPLILLEPPSPLQQRQEIGSVVLTITVRDHQMYEIFVGLVEVHWLTAWLDRGLKE